MMIMMITVGTGLVITSIIRTRVPLCGDMWRTSKECVFGKIKR